ncbi:glycoside hydrolase family 92 protein [Sphingomonas sp. CGMCC 1.13654]|uniref:Glycoside hydrolase family 92 protein n=1 Tax=Sphingomonas chungangi TaxID=2683589 RepID=A0A838L089_9SPHN|nr:GH92 family glycosyl hydrolase [Sphingomonas chungangi]MBA2932913.1 glycoside hydrolase family 92 protein [Sphingomonas chungangi]MVW56533.1 glycoside hydrolase family 92 protein [Sphingomonas chungangi]
MSLVRPLASALALILAAPALASPGYDAVDPMIGTSGGGHTYPGASAPFGMVQLSPDTDTSCVIRACYAHAAGYQYNDPTIQGFSFTHFSGAGHSDLGDFLIAPVSGDAAPLEPGDPGKPGSGYRSTFSHASEKAHPGYYAVNLDSQKVMAELTAGTRIGVARFTFANWQARQGLVLDLRSSLYNYPGKTIWSSIRLRPDGTVTGCRQTRGWAPDRILCFAMRFNLTIDSHSFVNTETDIPYKGFQGPGRDTDDVAQREGRAIVARFEFGLANDFSHTTHPLEVKVGISSVDEAGAIANLDSEPGSFDDIYSKTKASWEDALNAVDLDAPAAMKTSLYTALYHSLLAPSVASDVDGRYRGTDNQVHEAKDFTFRSTFSLWDTFRAEHPLLTIIQPERTNADFIRSLVESQKQSPFGILPVWQFQGRETWCMIGYHAVPIIADAYLKGIKGFDADEALHAMVASATYGPYGDLADYMKLGYVPIDKEPEAASKTVEYAYDDWTIAQMAKAMGNANIAATFAKRAANWRNGFDPKTGWVRARLSTGQFREPFDPVSIKYGSDYTEGNAWQYSWFMPQDEGGLIRALGGDAKTVAKLDAMFGYDNSKLDYSNSEDIAGLIGQYIHGNEPSHSVSYLYSYAGQPWRTQERLKQIVDSQYKPTPDGLVGNDDLGQMSAWLLFTGLGFYPVTPGSLQYVIGRPFVDHATLNLPDGKRFAILTEGLGDDHPYVAKVLLNGKPLDKGYITHAQIEAGGELRFVMSATPNKTWATAKAARPYSMTAY